MTMKSLNKPQYHLLAWGIVCVVAGLMTLFYLSLGLNASDKEPIVMPLDDTYIHFQYARQMASGDPYVYNPGDDPTSGATSFLYTPLLAIGYVLGFTDMALGFWALGLGGVLYVLSAWLIYLTILLRANDELTRTDWLLALMLTLGFLISGPVVWSAFSGMETLLMTTALLATLYALSCDDERLAIGASCVAALVRPEGAVVAMTVAGVLAVNARRLKLRYVLPMIAISTQPFVNLIVTGDASATGNQAKSHLYNTTIPLPERIESILDFWVRIWREWLTGINSVDGAYLPSFLFLAAMLAIVLAVRSSWKTRRIQPAVVVLVWLVGASAGIATLETAFWHFKRYQMPLMVLFFPLAGWFLLQWQGLWGQRIAFVISAAILILISFTTPDYARRYADNISVVTNQQVAMAHWVDNHLPADARLGVHDVGVMRYVGQRATYDLVGLTTEDVAAAWRQGAGTIYDTMLSHPQRPDYFAIYHDIQSLPLLAQAGVFGEELAVFTYPLPENTVASATSTQIVSQPTWPDDIKPMHTLGWMLPDDAELVASIDIGNLDDEHQVGYRRDFSWHEDAFVQPEGFASIVRNLPIAGCETVGCQWVNGARNTNGRQAINISSAADESRILLIVRVHAARTTVLREDCLLDIGDYAVVPDLPGQWVDLPIYLSENDHICVPDPTEIAYIWVYRVVNIETKNQPLQGTGIRFTNAPTPLSTFDFFLDSSYDEASDSINVNARWWSPNPGYSAAQIFVHLYADIDEAPIRQLDTYTNGYLPPANWLPNTVIEDTYQLSLTDLEVGTYTLAIGMYEPSDGRRYIVKTPDGENDRLFLGEIVVEP